MGNHWFVSESLKAISDFYRRIVPKNIKCNVPMLVLGSRNDKVFSEKQPPLLWAILTKL